MLKNLFSVLFVFSAVSFVFFGCEQKEDEKVEIVELVNTLGDPSVGNGSTGLIQDYFYTLDDEIEVQFYRYNSANFGQTYIDYLDI